MVMILIDFSISLSSVSDALNRKFPYATLQDYHVHLLLFILYCVATFFTFWCGIGF